MPETIHLTDKPVQGAARRPKIVGLVPARNERAIIGQCLRGLASFTDAIVYLDDASTDDTLEIVKSLAAECRVERIIAKEEWFRDEPKDRNMMLEAGREIGGTHFIVIDADEMLSSNLILGDSLVTTIRQMQQGDRLAVNWIQLWRTIDEYRFDASVWTWNYKEIIFCDDGTSCYSSEFIHTPRIPGGLTGTRHKLEGYQAGLLHFQFVNWENLLIKQAWYRCLERIRDPQKPVEEINRRYAPSQDETDLGVMPAPAAWYENYPFFDRTVYDIPEQWREEQVLTWYSEYGREHFAGLDISAVAWGEGRKEGRTVTERRFKASAIVSTYNSKLFIAECLKDLLGQSLYQQGELEIIVIDSGSQQDEESVVRAFQSYWEHIVYLKTPRETLYSAWNRGIRMARGRYLTNANTDDRHAPNALELLCKRLDERDDVDLVYSDCYLSTSPNELFYQNDRKTVYRYPDYFGPASLLHYQFGPQPVWRKSLHDKIGLFDGSFRAAGDYDFSIRFSVSGCKALHVAEPLGLYLEHQSAISFRDNKMELENQDLSRSYKTTETVETMYRTSGIDCGTPEERGRVLVDMGIRCLEFYPPWRQGGSASDVPFAVQCFQKAADVSPGAAAPLNNLALLEYFYGDSNRALALLTEADKGTGNEAVRHNLRQIADHTLTPESARFIPSGLKLPRQVTLYLGTQPEGHDLSNQSEEQQTVSIIPNLVGLADSSGENGSELSGSADGAANLERAIRKNKTELSTLLQSLRTSHDTVIAVWGAGTAGRQAQRFLEAWNLSTSFFVDKDSGKWGKSVGDTVINPPEHLISLKQEGKSVFVFIASMWHKEIAASLTELGFHYKSEFISLPLAGA